MSQPCGCCSGIEIVTPQIEVNNAGLSTIAYRVGTYATFYETMLARLSNLYIDVPAADGSGTIDRLYPLQQLTTREASDPAIALLDAWAVIADVLTFYQERIANEGYLLTATERRSILELARLVGYKLRPGVSASVYLAFTVTPGFDGIIPAGTRAQSVPTTGSPQFYETSADFEARDVWNGIGPRLTRPQVIAPGGVPGLDPESIRTLYIQGLTTSLKPGDGILITTSDIPVETISEEEPPQLLRIVDSVNPQPTDQRTQVVLRDYSTGSTELLEASTLKTLAQVFITEASTIFQGSAQAAQVVAILSGLTATPATYSPATAVAALELLLTLAETRGFTRLQAWLSDLVGYLDLYVLAGSYAGTKGTEFVVKAQATTELMKLTSIVENLALPQSLQPASSIQMTRTVSQIFAPHADIAPQMIAHFYPAASANLYQAWDNIAVAPSDVHVYAARAKATLFAGSFAGQVEMNLSTGTPKVNPPILQDAVSDLVVTAATGSSLAGLPLDAVYDQIRVGSWVAIVRPDVNLDGTQADTAATFQTVTTYHQVVSLQTASRETGSSATPTGFAAKVTQLELNPPWLFDLTSTEFTNALASTMLLRGTVVYAQAEELTLAEEPLDRDVSGSTIELDGLYDGLTSGRWVIVSGERTDIPNTTGITASELVMIAGVAQAGPAVNSCVTVPASDTLAFLSVYYITPPNASGDQLVVGAPNSELVSFLDTLPSESSPQPICGPFQLAPGLFANAYVPTQAEIAGNFSDFAALLTDPYPGNTAQIQGGVIPSIRFANGGEQSVYAWRISSVTSQLDTPHSTLVLANSLAYTYDSGTVTIYANVTDATHGQTTGEVLGNGNASLSFQKMALHQSPLTYLSAPTPSGATSTLNVTVNEIDWQEDDNVAEMGPTDHAFITQTDNSAITSVIFGNGVYGARVPTGNGNVKAVYRYGIGSVGNVDAGQISQLATRPLGAQAVINPLPATGGADADTLDQARANVPIAVMALDRLVSVSDYAAFSRNYAGIGKAASSMLTDGRRQLVYVTIAGAEDIPIDTTSDLYNNLVQSLMQYGDPQQPIIVGVRKLKLLVISAGVCVLPNYNFVDVAPNVQAALLNTFSFDNRNLGQCAFLSEAVAAIQAVEGVAYSNITVFDSVSENVTATQLASLNNTLVLRNRVTARLAEVDPNVDLATSTNLAQDMARRFKPAELVIMTPDIQDTLILNEITATNAGPTPNLPLRRRSSRVVYSVASFQNTARAVAVQAANATIALNAEPAPNATLNAPGVSNNVP
jgi:hypothetical protein